MVWEPIKFHDVHGENIRLSLDCLEATKEETLGLHALCFTNRPLERGEKLVFRILFRNASSDFVGIGVTGNEPSKQDLPMYLRPGFNAETGFTGGVLRSEANPVRLDMEIVMYINETIGNVMIQNVGSEPITLIKGIELKKPVYAIVDLFVNAERVRINSYMHLELPKSLALTDLETEARLEEKAQRHSLMKPAFFTALRCGGLTVHQKRATSNDPSPSRGNFVFVDTPLKPNHTLFVELTALKQSRPLLIILTTKDAHYVYTEGRLPLLCETTYSLAMESLLPKTADELAISISGDGVVRISHNGCDWVKRMCVDTDLEYHVVFDMQHISVLSMIGITTTVKGETKSIVVSPDSLPEARSTAAPECIICLENARIIALLPCFHFALCGSCAHSLQRSGDAKCPVCRERIADMKKIYMA